MGAITRENISPICVWPTLVPRTSPIAAARHETSRARRTKSSGREKERPTPEPMTSQAVGRTTSPAAIAWSMPATTFSTATHSISIGERRRSSISRVNWNSETSGIATDQTPERSMASAMMPGSSIPLYSGRISPLDVITFPKTNTSSIG